jgi:prepilin-type N-terminal cleavage/methylation domain-containing protein/prepilin-type processing-associated H-X9-DG protein
LLEYYDKVLYLNKLGQDGSVRNYPDSISRGGENHIKTKPLCNHKSRFHMLLRGFTLIELLVVIGILAVLLAMLMPALSKAREQARDAICKTNLHDYGIVGTMYTSDYEDRFPEPRYWLYQPTTLWSATSSSVCWWHNANLQPDGSLWSYLQDKDINMCPTFYNLAPLYAGQISGHNPTVPVDPQYSYSMNGYLGPKFSSTWADRVAKVTNVLQPSEVMFFGEENLFTISGVSIYCLNDTVMLSRTLHNYYKVNDCDAIGSFHNIEGKDHSSGTSNLVFIDGSVGTGMPEESFDLSWPF